MFGELWRRMQFRFRRKRFDEDLAEEMRLHLELRALEGGGQAQARRRFGNEVLLREASREAWGWTFLETLWQDLRYGARNLNSSRGFAAVAVLSLALGIGANTAIFSIVNAVMLRSLPVEDPGRLVQVQSGDSSNFTNPIWEQIRDRQNGFSGVLAFGQDRFDLSPGGVSQYAQGLWVSGNFFHVLGVPALRGRVFTADDDRRGGGKDGAVAVISYAFWKSQLAGDRDAVGKTIHLNRHPFQIVGVTPEWFHGLNLDRGYGVAIPIACEPILHGDGSWLDARSTWWLRVLGRLGPGMSIGEAQARLRALSPTVFRATLPPDWGASDRAQYTGRLLSATPAATGFSNTGTSYRKALFALMGVVGLVVLIACANVANLLLARAAAREREIAVRLAIGAGRLRVIRQLLTESFLLSGLSAGLGLLFALWGSRALVHLLSETGNELEFDLSIDAHVLLFTIGVATMTGLMFGLAPAVRATRVSPNESLKEGARGTVAGASRFHLGKALVILQVALSVPLLVGAGLFLATMNNLLRVDTGFNRQNVLIANVDVLEAGVPKEMRANLFADAVKRLRRAPGVLSAASSALTPISGSDWNQLIYPAGKLAKSEEDKDLYLNRVSPGYFAAMGTPLLVGRDFSERDTLTSPKAIVLSETTARAFFGSENPVGKIVEMDDEPGKRKPLTVIGVVKDAKYRSLDQDAALKTGFLAASQDKDPMSGISFEVRSRTTAEAIEPTVRDVLTRMDRGVSIEFRNFETQVNDSMRRQEVVAWLSAFFGALALLLAMIGLYGVTAYSVARRRGEIGIRMALGAQQRAVVWLVMRDVVVMLGLGAITGTAVSLALGKLVDSLLFGVKPSDPMALGLAAAVLGAAAVIAAYVPARQAARLDPMTALRSE